ncbi:hypothetical protein LCGC14_1729920 [marine sediment metagenome]|uniref:Uncharacterized protein n=1 Tax=marine sediment metagenome TaxID=412755 RepID=A0A0F9H9Y4_9ZZZZ
MDKSENSAKRPLSNLIEGKDSSRLHIQDSTQVNSSKTPTKPTEYFHQYFSDSKQKGFPSSLVITDTDQGKTLILSEKLRSPNKGEFKFLSPEDPSLTNGNYRFKLFSNKDILTQAIDSFKAGRQFSSHQLDKVFVAVDRGLDKAIQWVGSKKNEVSKNQFKDSEIPYAELENIGIKKESLSQEDIQALRNGGYTALKTIDLKSEKANIKNTPDFKINLERSETGAVRARLTFKKDYPDLEKDAIGAQLSGEELRELARDGKLEKTVNFSDGKGGSIPNKIMLDKDTNRIIRKSLQEYNLESVLQIKETYGIKLSPQEEKSLNEGKPVKVNGINVPGLKGAYRGELDLSPLTGSAELKIAGPDRARKQQKEFTLER